jgi:hypothetical protein
MPDRDERDESIAFKAEMKLDLKYIRGFLAEQKKTTAELTKKVNKQCTEIAVLKTKVAIYAGLIGGATGLIATIVTALIKG